MYFLFRFHDMLPHQYKELGQGEKIILRAFMHRQIHDMIEERKGGSM